MMLTEIFDVVKGSGEYFSKVESGDVPLISATSVNNGVIGRTDQVATFKAPCITVERVAGQAYVQLEDFATVPDDLTVLIPKDEMSTEQLLYVAAVINASKWRFSYGRKLTKTRLKKLIDIDLSKMPTTMAADIDRFTIKTPTTAKPEPPHRFQEKLVTDYFDLVHGNFHSLDELDEGPIATVSRVTYNNGVVGRFEQPDRAVIHPALTLTVSTTSGDAFLQLEEFMATDNVVVLVPKNPYSLYFLLYVQAVINRTKWRYYYGRQCYKNRFAKTKIYLPLNSDGSLDESYIEQIVKSSPGWEELSSYIATTPTE